MKKRPNPLKPERVRSIEKPFAWIPFRLLRDEYLEDTSDQAKLLYLFLCIVSDRHGLSFYGDSQIHKSFQLEPSNLRNAREELISKDLIAFNGRIYQVLSLPQKTPLVHPNHTEHKPDKPESLSEIFNRLSQYQEK